MPRAVSTSGRLPVTRRAALEFWSRCIATLSLVATSTIALGAAFLGISGTLPDTLVGLALVSALPFLWITLARFAEKRLFSRPTKRFLSASLGLDASGIVLVSAAVVLLQANTSHAASIFAVGEVLEGCGTLLLLLWFLAARIAAPTSDHMHPL
jgi:nucleoside recognition membrane protein YjiH